MHKFKIDKCMHSNPTWWITHFTMQSTKHNHALRNRPPWKNMRHGKIKEMRQRSSSGTFHPCMNTLCSLCNTCICWCQHELNMYMILRLSKCCFKSDGNKFSRKTHCLKWYSGSHRRLGEDYGQCLSCKRLVALTYWYWLQHTSESLGWMNKEHVKPTQASMAGILITACWYAHVL